MYSERTPSLALQTRMQCPNDLLTAADRSRIVASPDHPVFLASDLSISFNLRQVLKTADVFLLSKTNSSVRFSQCFCYFCSFPFIFQYSKINWKKYLQVIFILYLYCYLKLFYLASVIKVYGAVIKWFCFHTCWREAGRAEMCVIFRMSECDIFSSELF